MKKLFLQTVRFWLLLGFLLSPAQNWCAVAMLQEPAAHALPLPALDQSSEPMVKGYALKGMLKSIMDVYPGITVQEALLRSPLLAEMNRDWMLQTYGEFTVAPDRRPGREGYFITKFVTETPLNQITRILFNSTDGTIRPTEQPSNPFLGLNATAIASMVKIMHSEGIEGLIRTLQTQCEVEQKPAKPKGKGGSQPVSPSSTSPTPTDAIVKQWYETYKAIPKSGKLTDFGRFKKAIREQFILQLTALNAQAITPEDKAKTIEDLSKLFMTSLYLKDQTEGTINPDYSIPTYFKALGSNDFTGEHYTRAELEELDKLFKRESSKASLHGIEGIEAAAFYLEDKIYGGIQALQAPYFPFKSTPLTDPANRFDGKGLTDCNESAIRSILNLAAYDSLTGNLNTKLLPSTMNPQVRMFFENHNDPSASNYYQETAKEWLPLVSGIKEVHYNQNAPQGKFEINGGPKNLLAVLNHLLGASADSFESLGTALSSKDPDGRKISFIRSQAGYLMNVSDKTGTIAQGTLLSREGVEHGAFLIQNGGLYDLIESNFVPLVQEMNKSLEGTGDLFKICFTDKTLHSTRIQDQLPPLEFAAKNGLTDALRVMLQYETKPVDYKNLLYTAIRGSKTIETVKYLLTVAKHLNYQALLSNAASAGNMQAIRLFLRQYPNPDLNDLLNNAASSSSGNIILVEFLLTYVPNRDYNDLLRRAASSGSLKLVTFFHDRGGDIMKPNPYSRETALDTAIDRYLDFFYYDHRMRRTDVENKAGCYEIIEFLVKNGAVVTEKNFEDITMTDNLELIQLLLSHLADPNYQLLQLLNKAISSGSLDLVMFCIDKGADVNARSKEGISPLDNALLKCTYTKNYSIIKLLLQRGAIVTQKSLEIGIENEELINLLLPHFPNPNYDQLLRIAATQSYGSTIKMFIDKGANINAIDAQGKTILHEVLELYIATRDVRTSLQYPRVAKELVAQGAIVTQEDIMSVSTRPLFDFLQNARTEQSFGLPLTSQEIKCITECVMEAL